MKTILVDAFNTLVKPEWLNKEMLQLLETYKNTKYILTNADEKAQKELGLINLPYEMFTMSFTPLKSDPSYFKTFLKEKNLDISDVVYFEHNADAVKSAESLWIKTHHYDHEKQDLKSLEQFLNENL